MNIHIVAKRFTVNFFLALTRRIKRRWVGANGHEIVVIHGDDNVAREDAGNAVLEIRHELLVDFFAEKTPVGARARSSGDLAPIGAASFAPPRHRVRNAGLRPVIEDDGDVLVSDVEIELHEREGRRDVVVLEALVVVDGNVADELRLGVLDGEVRDAHGEEIAGNFRGDAVCVGDEESALLFEIDDEAAAVSHPVVVDAHFLGAEIEEDLAALGNGIRVAEGDCRTSRDDEGIGKRNNGLLLLLWSDRGTIILILLLSQAQRNDE